MSSTFELLPAALSLLPFPQPLPLRAAWPQANLSRRKWMGCACPSVFSCPSPLPQHSLLCQRTHRDWSCSPGSEEDSSLYLTFHFPAVTKPWGFFLGKCLSCIFLRLQTRSAPDVTGLWQECSSWSPFHPVHLHCPASFTKVSLFTSPSSRRSSSVQPEVHCCPAH